MAEREKDSLQVNDELQILSQNLTRLMQDKNLDSKEISALTGISVSLLNKLKRGEGNPTLGTLISLANFLGVSIDTLVSPTLTTQEPVTVIPLYELDQAHDVKKAESSKSNIFLKTQEIHNDHLFAVKIKNASLSPFFDKGSVFIISEKQKFTDGDIVLVRINDEYNVFRKIFIKNKGLLFQYISLEADPHVYDNYRIIGPAVKVIHHLAMSHE